MTTLTRRTLLGSSAALGSLGALAPTLPAQAATGIVKPVPADLFHDYGTNAEMRWDSVDPRAYLTDQSRLFVRNHTVTPSLTKEGYALSVHGDGLASPRTADDPARLTYAELRAMPATTLVAAHECTGNGRSFFTSQQGQTVSGTSWKLGAVGTVRWEGVRLRDVLARVGISPGAVSIQATGLDPSYSTGGVDYGPVRRPFPVGKALDDALLAWGANGADLLPDHGFPLRLVLPGWVGIASIKWLGSLEVATTELQSPWNTKWYNVGRPLTTNPVRSAWELPWGAQLRKGKPIRLTGRSWSGAGAVRRVDVSTDGGRKWRAATLDTASQQGQGWTRWSTSVSLPPGAHTLMARATDVLGRTQPVTAAYNENGYFFDAVVKHPVTAR